MAYHFSCDARTGAAWKRVRFTVDEATAARLIKFELPYCKDVVERIRTAIGAGRPNEMFWVSRQCLTRDGEEPVSLGNQQVNVTPDNQCYLWVPT
jgi:hypothetical protein